MICWQEEGLDKEVKQLLTALRQSVRISGTSQKTACASEHPLGGLPIPPQVKLFSKL